MPLERCNRPVDERCARHVLRRAACGARSPSRRDGRAARRLPRRVRRLGGRHVIRTGRGIRAQPARLYSAGGLGSSALRSMGITPPGPKFAHLRPAVLGASLGAFHGGMAETVIIRRRLPAVVADFSAAYPTIARLIRAWDVLRAERVEIEDVTSELAAWLTELGSLPLPDLLGTLIDPETDRKS